MHTRKERETVTNAGEGFTGVHYTSLSTFQNKKLGWVKEEPERWLKERNLSHKVFLNTREDGGSNEWDNQSIGFPDSIWKEARDQ